LKVIATMHDAENIASNAAEAIDGDAKSHF
jgi:hypothetical protein